MDTSENLIVLTHDNISSYGFVCFYQEEQPLTSDSYLTREVAINVGGEKGNTIQRFQIPKEFLIELSNIDKVVNSRNYKINSSSSSIKAIKRLSERAGWNQTKEDLNVIINHDQGGTFIASYTFLNQDIPLGSGISFPINTDLSWIGMILVHPELRRQGIARSIMTACLEHARLNQNKSIVGLDATPLGKQVYDSLGFKDSFTIWRSILSTNIKSNDFSKSELKTLNIESVKNYLEEKDYLERMSIIELLSEIKGSKSFMIKAGDKINGFVMSRPGRLKPFIGPLIADSNEVALLLLQKALNYWNGLGYEDVIMDIPEYHLNNSIFFDEEKPSDATNHKIPVKPVRSFIRMYQLVASEELIEKSTDSQSLEFSISESALKKAIDCYDIAVDFMRKEKRDIVPIMFGTSGPEWS